MLEHEFSEYTGKSCFLLKKMSSPDVHQILSRLYTQTQKVEWFHANTFAILSDPSSS